MEFPFVVVPGISRGFNDEAALGSGQVEFEQISEDHAVGLKAPDPSDPFEMTDTIARETLRKRRREEEHAEEKRVLYVACTRARDHLLLSGRHELDSDAESLSLTGIEDADPESPSSWRDWVQLELLTDDILSALDEDTHAPRELGEGVYTVSLPTPPVDLPQPDPDPDPIVKLSPTPDRPELTFQFSATDLASLLGGYGELRIDNATRTAYVDEQTEDEDTTSPDSRHGEPSPALSDAGASEQSTSASETPDHDVGPMVFGELVHRICELRPPEHNWSDLMEQTLVDQDADVSLTIELQDRVSKHATRGTDYVDSQTDDVDVEHQYDELYVTAEFDTGEISGYIDHLIITPDAYHIIDYKTGDITPNELEEDAEYYVNQMKAYAIALNQQDTGRSVRVSLVFTAIDDAWEVEWVYKKLETIQSAIETELTDHLTTVF
jgi:ATP-dependent helicase/nuclease subunit A